MNSYNLFDNMLKYFEISKSIDIDKKSNIKIVQENEYCIPFYLGSCLFFLKGF